ncbi:MAG: hypothetical protein OXH65_05620 [Paracoccaceae bacterium]|nr:hypothetical protein [Paracoccaceae bacterium]MDE2674571.1 hypothetical protein [Paracoccaceae bacterium]
MPVVKDKEKIARLLFYPMMVKNGVLTPAAFPMDELLAQKDKNGSSVDRYDLLNGPENLLYQKARKNANPNAGRNPFGFGLAYVRDVRSLKINSGSDQALEIYPDALQDKQHPDPWDHAHALVRKYCDTYKRGRLRGVRDYLIELFSENIHEFNNPH